MAEADGGGEEDTVMSTPEQNKQIAAPTMSPQEAERQKLESYIEQVEKYQEGRYSKSFRNATDGKYEVEQVSMKEAESSVDTAEACSITYINIDRDPKRKKNSNQ